MGKHILITGASGGIGSAIARKLALPGHHIILQGRNEALLMALQEYVIAQGATAEVWVCDFLNLDEDNRFQSSTLLDQIDYYIHSSGHALYKMLMDTSVLEWDQLFQIHIRSAFQISKKIIPRMVSNKFGRIILISSIWGEVGASCEVAYSAAKGAVSSYTKALAKELAPSGITVNAIAPGAIETPMIYNQLEKSDVIALQEQIPLGRLGQPEEIASLVEFLLGEQSGYITGQVLNINGGWR